MYIKSLLSLWRVRLHIHKFMICSTIIEHCYYLCDSVIHLTPTDLIFANLNHPMSLLFTSDCSHLRDLQSMYVLPSVHTPLRHQVTLTLSYATTFNSCQGLNPNRVAINLTNPAFFHSQLYTALSFLNSQPQLFFYPYVSRRTHYYEWINIIHNFLIINFTLPYAEVRMILFTFKLCQHFEFWQHV